MMSVLQNALPQLLVADPEQDHGSLVFVLLTPLSHWSWFLAYVAPRWRAAAVGAGDLRHLLFRDAGFRRAALDPRVRRDGRGDAGIAGIIAGLWAENRQMAAFQNFVIMPMTFLSGVFYSIRSLPLFGRM